MTRDLDRRWLAVLGLLAGCGPEAPGLDGTGSSAETTPGGTTGHGTTAGATTTNATTAGETTSLTTGVTGVTTTPVECVDDSDCDPFCEYCVDGACEFDVCCPHMGCCYDDCCYYTTPAGREIRCEPYFECFDDYDCPPDHVCDSGYCLPAPPPQPVILPECPPGQVSVTQWDLTQSPGGLGLGDVDGDGDLDVFAALPTTGEVELAFNDGAGTFTPGGVIDTGEPQTDLRVTGGDLDGDGDLDLVVARPDTGDLAVLFNQDGMFVPGPLLPVSLPPRTITAGDLDGDGDLDLLSFAGDHEIVSTRAGDGLGGFSAEMVPLILADAFVSAVAHADLDGVADLLTLPAPNGVPAVGLYRGAPDITWLFDQEFAADAPTWTQALAGDLGAWVGPEVIALCVEGDGGVARVWEGIDGVTWSPGKNYVTSSPLTGGKLVDGDGDGNLDLAAATGAAMVSVLLGDGQGGFLCERVHAVAAATYPEVLASGELDGDTGAELVVGSRDGPTVMVLRAL